MVSEATVGTGIKLAYVQPHMHLRGKDYVLRLAYPKGARIIGISHFDNSPNNKYNPDPAREVRWGPQNWNEMSNAFIGLIFDAKIAQETPGGGPACRVALIDVRHAAAVRGDLVLWPGKQRLPPGWFGRKHLNDPGVHTEVSAGPPEGL